ncbi:MAG: helix-turn-helix domain-containing protein [Alphaproteobacteria bacterium]|nr:helix-turn-helix domain-containing protein [Alphaproteobacteria bacterium]
MLDQKAVAEYLSVKPRTLEDWRLKGTGPRFVRMSPRCVRYRLDDVAAWAEARTVRNTAEPVRADA